MSRVLDDKDLEKDLIENIRLNEGGDFLVANEWYCPAQIIKHCDPHRWQIMLREHLQFLRADEDAVYIGNQFK